jgi:hypothetical protein
VKRIDDDVVLYVEGGGDSASLRAACRQAFAEFFSKTALGSTRRPSVVACGGRNAALEAFGTALLQGKNALLLVDSEDPVDQVNQGPLSEKFKPWHHLKQRDGWEQPRRARDEDCHLMVQCMESWFVADWLAVAAFFARDFETKHKPTQTVEDIPKADVYEALLRATVRCAPKGRYGKGAHSFKLLGLISPVLVCAASPWAMRLLDELKVRKP